MMRWRRLIAGRVMRRSSLCHVALASLVLASCGVDRQQATAPAAETGAAAPVSLEAAFTCLRERRLAVVSAHRGQPDPDAAENALSSLRESLAAGVPILEIDIATARDGTLVLMHDETLDRTTTGNGPVAEKTYNELKSLNIRRDDGRLTDDRVPTLAAALAWGRTAGAYFQLDVKKSTRFADVVAAVHKARMRDRVIVITYNQADAITVHRLDPALLVSVAIDSPADVNALAAQGFNPDRLLAWTGNRDERPDLWRALAGRGIEPLFGTLGRPGARLDDRYIQDGDPSEYRALAQAGVTMIASDRAATAAMALGNDHQRCMR